MSSPKASYSWMHDAGIFRLFHIVLIQSYMTLFLEQSSISYDELSAKGTVASSISNFLWIRPHVPTKHCLVYYVTFAFIDIIIDQN